jgi:hypothetical protein
MIGLTALLVAAALPVYAANVINVRDFGAKGDGVSDDTGAINKAIAAGVKLGPGTQVFVPAGKYLLLKPTGNGHVNIENANQFTLRGEKGTELMGDDPNKHIISIDGSKNVTIKDLTIEQDKYYFSQGVVVAEDHVNHTVDLQLDPGYPELDAPQVVVLAHWTVRMVDPKRLAPYVDEPANFGVAPTAFDKVGDRRWRLKFNDFHGWPPVSYDMDVVGQRMLLWDDRRGCHGINFSNDSDCLIQDVNYYGKGVNAGIFLANCSGTMTFRRYVIGCPPGSDGLLSCSGGGQFLDMRGSLVFDHCDYSRFDDDGADIFTLYHRVHAQNDSRNIVVEKGNFRVGDEISVVDWADKAVRSRAVISAIADGPNNDTLLTLNSDVTALRVGMGNSKNLDAQEQDNVDRVTDYNDACASVTFTGCKFQCNRARPLNLKCQNCTVQGCDFYNCQMAPIEAGPEMWWGEAPDIHNLKIVNSRFYSFNEPAIDIGIFGANEDTNTALDNQNILIEGNRFDKWGKDGAIRLRNAQHVVLKNNWFGRSREPLKLGKGIINVSHCEDVVESGNKGL